jgi:ABC-type Fe3+/spermidine/putrescine transport system ATPase subunit
VKFFGEDCGAGGDLALAKVAQAVTPSLELTSVVRDYGKGVRVGPISFSAEPGSFVSILGPSGCGKTTLLRCVAGFEPVDEGHLLIDGKEISGLPAHRRGVGLVFQNYALFPHLSVRDNVAFGLRLRRVDKAERLKRADSALQIVGLNHLADRLPSQISGGQQQRVAIARSLVLEPSIMLLDEPLSNLDYKLRLQMRRELLTLQRRLGMTFVFVTHDQSEALALSDRIIVLSQGRIEQIGTPAEIYNRPRSYFVADFIGGSNLLKAVGITKMENGLVSVVLEAGPKVVAACDDVEATRSGAWLSIRPEQLKLLHGAATAEDTDGILSGRPVSRIFAGDRVEVTMQIEMPEAAAPAQLTFYADPDEPIGDTVSVRVAKGAAVLVGGAP